MSMKRIRKAFRKDENNQKSISNMKNKVDSQMAGISIITY